MPSGGPFAESRQLLDLLSEDLELLHREHLSVNKLLYLAQAY